MGHWSNGGNAAMRQWGQCGAGAVHTQHKQFRFSAVALPLMLPQTLSGARVAVGRPAGVQSTQADLVAWTGAKQSVHPRRRCTNHAAGSCSSPRAAQAERQQLASPCPGPQVTGTYCGRRQK
jgi:hypothetical protein